jgi:hypothetical protein
LFSAIVATVGATTERRLTVRELAMRVGAPEDVTAQCIALHRHFRNHDGDPTTFGLLSMPTPEGFWVPLPDDFIDEAALGLSGPPAGNGFG